MLLEIPLYYNMIRTHSWIASAAIVQGMCVYVCIIACVYVYSGAKCIIILPGDNYCSHKELCPTTSTILYMQDINIRFYLWLEKRQ